jgi:hypothetical protein
MKSLIDHIIDETAKPTGELKKACWKGYVAVGTKKKSGRTVPNCVPEQHSPIKSTPHGDTASKPTHLRQSEIKKNVHLHKPVGNIRTEETDGYPHHVHVRDFSNDDQDYTFPRDHVNHGINTHDGTYRGSTDKGHVFGFKTKERAASFVHHVNSHKHTHAEHLTEDVIQEADKKDTITFDIPLLIRVFELVREDIKTDVDLHKVVERLIDMRHNGILTMDDYNNIAHLKEEVEQIQELGPETLKSYKQKSNLDKYYTMKNPSAPDALNPRKWLNRNVGADRARKKLGEDVDHTHAVHFKDKKSGEWVGKMLLIAKDDEDAKKQAHDLLKGPEFHDKDIESVIRHDIIEAKTPAWQRKAGKNPEGGLNKAGVASYRREHPGSKLKTAVTTKPSKLKPGSKAANRRKSFCSRMKGMKAKLTSAKTARDPDSRINKSLRKWNCN